MSSKQLCFYLLWLFAYIRLGIGADGLLENMLDEIYYGRATANDEEIERMIDLTSEKGVFIKINSLAERIKVDEFIEELTVNPYQLKLIA